MVEGTYYLNDQRSIAMILITGATGYIGRHLVARLVAQGERPRCLVRNKERAERVLPAEDVELVEGSTTQADSLGVAMRGVETVVHAAFITADRKQSAGKSHDKSGTYEETNVQGTANVISAAKDAGVQRVIEISGLGTKADKVGSYMQG